MTTSGEEKQLLNSIRNLPLTVYDVEHVVEILDLILELNTISEKGRLAGFIRWNPLLVNFEEGKQKRYSPQLIGQFKWFYLVSIAKKTAGKCCPINIQAVRIKSDSISRDNASIFGFFPLIA